MGVGIAGLLRGFAARSPGNAQLAAGMQVGSGSIGFQATTEPSQPGSYQTVRIRTKLRFSIAPGLKIDTPSIAVNVIPGSIMDKGY